MEMQTAEVSGARASGNVVLTHEKAPRIVFEMSGGKICARKAKAVLRGERWLK